jgi:hypothetical protein
MSVNFNDPRLVEARLKAKAGTLTFDELKAAIAIMREGRQSAHVVSAKARSAAAPVNTEDLLKELDLNF